jgi:hypothetical protein
MIYIGELYGQNAELFSNISDSTNPKHSTSKGQNMLGQA